MAEDFAATDAQLVERARLGDAAAFDVLVRRYVRAAHALAASLLLDPLDAEDVCQNAFVHVVEKLDECRTPERFAGWLFVIVRNAAHNFRRRERLRQTESLDGVDPPNRDDPSVDAERREMRGRLARALAQLTDAECDVVLLHDLEGRTHRAIAASLGMSEVNSRQQLFVARRKLRESLHDLRRQVHD